jgi:hypothetical protein
MRTARLLLTIVPAALLLPLAFLLRSRAWPLGVPGEWEWLRLAPDLASGEIGLAALAVLAYTGCAALGLRFLQRRTTPMREGLALTGLLAAALGVQAAIPVGAPQGYGLAKWALVLHLPASTGYYTVARQQVHDARQFLAGYPDWIRRQDSLHVGTHPPGLFVVEHALLRAFAARPDLARGVVDAMPATVTAGFRSIAAFEPLPLADRATLGVTGALTLAVCAATVVPLYSLARACLSAPGAWSAAALWPLVPAAILFQPLPDTAYPLLAATALALAAAGSPWLAFAAGLILAAGMALTLAFLAVGLVVAIVLAADTRVSLARRALLLLATGLGFLAPTLGFWLATGADPFLIWWWNQRNHARFYVEYHRTYWRWLLVNPLELGIALGIPATAWALAGLATGARRLAPRVAWATVGVLVLLTLSGRNLSEVARLWLPLMPGLLVAAGAGLERLEAGPGTLAATVATLGIETLLLQATIQVVYPV